MCNNHWYLFIRLHQILCERLTKMYNQAVVIAGEEAKDKRDRKESTAVALRLKPKSKSTKTLQKIYWHRFYFYPHFLTKSKT